MLVNLFLLRFDSRNTADAALRNDVDGASNWALSWAILIFIVTCFPDHLAGTRVIKKIGT